MLQGQVKINYRLQYSGIVEKNLYTPHMDVYSTMGEDPVIAYAAQASNCPQETLRAVYEALFDAFDYYMANGHSVELPGIGIFALSMNCKTNVVNAASPVIGAAAIKKVGVKFLPCMDLKHLLKKVTYSTGASNPNNLTPFTTGLARGIEMNGVKLFWGGVKSSSRNASVQTANSLVVYGYNMEQITFLTVTGTKGGSAATATVELNAVGKNGLKAAGAFPGSAFDTITKFTIEGEDWLLGQGSSQNGFYMGSTRIYSGGVFTVNSQPFVYYGDDAATVAIKVDGTAITPLSRTASSVVFANSLAVGAHTLQAGTASSVNFTLTTTAVPSVENLTANGVRVSNGGSSTIQPDTSYAFVATGQNLSSLTAADISVPAGCTISGFLASATRVQFTMTTPASPAAGILSIGSLFSVNCVLYTPGEDAPTVSSVAGIANGGNYTASTTAEEVDIIGTNLSDIALGMFGCQAGESLSFSNLVKTSATAASVEVSGLTDSYQSLIVYADTSKTTTLFTLHIRTDYDDSGSYS